MVKQRRSLCFTFVGNSTVNTGFWQFCCFFVYIFVKILKNSSKSYKMTFGMQRSMCEKVANFNRLKVTKQVTLNENIYKIFSFNTLQYWANAYSFRSGKLVRVFCRKNALKMSKIELLNGYFH